MKMIYHIFNANVYFVNLSLIESYIKFSKYNHFYLIAGVIDSTKIYYDELFLKYHYSKYTYLSENSFSKKTRIISILFRRILNTQFHSFEINLLKYISYLSDHAILIHGNFSTMFYFSLNLRLMKYSNINWVCWGNIYFLYKDRNIRFYRLRNAIYKRIYKNYSNIICLMQEDCDELKKLYKLNNTLFLPYYDEAPLIIDKLNLKGIKMHNDIRILLGNSGRCIDSYYEDLVKLRIHRKNNISIDCMLNYGSTENQNSDLIKFATLIFGVKFIAHTVVWQKEEYYNFMSKFDIYISSRKTQSGLGAIYIQLLLGKKVYLAGKNFEHLKNSGTIVFHSDQLSELSFKDLCFPLTSEEKKHNKSVIMGLLDIETLTYKWDQFYTIIMNKSY